MGREANEAAPTCRSLSLQADNGNHALRRVVLPASLSASATVTASPSATPTPSSTQRLTATSSQLGSSTGSSTPSCTCTVSRSVSLAATPSPSAPENPVYPATEWNVTTLAGTLLSSGHADGVGTSASFYSPTGIAVDGAGMFAFVVHSTSRID